MHKLIRFVVKADSPARATEMVGHLFTGRDAQMLDVFDYGIRMTDPDARWRDSMPDTVTETGAIKVNTQEGTQIVESAWVSTAKRLSEHMAIVRKAFNELSDDEILSDAKVEAPVEPYSPFGLLDEDDCKDEFSCRPRYSMRVLGERRGPSYALYDRYGTAIRSSDAYEELIEDVDEQAMSNETSTEYYVVPYDVHF